MKKCALLLAILMLLCTSSAVATTPPEAERIGLLLQTGGNVHQLDSVYAAENGQPIHIETTEPTIWAGWKLIEKLLVLLLCHFVGDFALQSTYLSEKKKCSRYHLTVHCFLYILPFYVCFGMCWQLGGILLAHFIIDTAKARKNRINFSQDQALHLALLLLYLF